MKKLIGALVIALAGCGGGGSSVSEDYWQPIWVYNNCIGVSACAYKIFNTQYSSESVCLASPEVTNTTGMPSNVRATCYHSVPQ